MDQEIRFQISFKNEVDEYSFKDYHALIQELEVKHNGKCLLFDQISGNLITTQNFEFFNKLTLFRIKDYPDLLKQLQEYECNLNLQTNSMNDEKKKADELLYNAKQTILELEAQKAKITDKVDNLEKENTLLKSQLNNQEEIKRKFEDLKAQNANFNAEIVKSKTEIDKLSMNLIKSKSNLEQLSLELQTSKEQMMHYQIQSKNLQTELKQSQEQLNKSLTDQRNLSIQLLKSKDSHNLGYGNHLEKIYNDAQQQEEQKMHGQKSLE